MQLDKSIDSTKRFKDGSINRSGNNSSPLEQRSPIPHFKNVNDIGLKEVDRFSRSSAESDDEDEK